MRAPRVLCLSLALAAMLPALGRAQVLNIGDKAPALAVSKWVKGGEVAQIEDGKFYVVEFWATWCGPCIQTIPHLTELQKKNPDVTFIGVSVWESDQDAVAPFVKEMGDKMDYHVAMDDVPEGKDGSAGKMASAWMTAAGENGIPTAFIVAKDGQIAWIGHPASMDEPLAKITAGDWNIESAAKERADSKVAEQRMQSIFEKLGPLLNGGKHAEALDVIQSAIAEYPALEAGQLGFLQFNLLAQLGRNDEAVTYGRKLLSGKLGENAMALNAIAWSLVDPDRPAKAGKPLLAFAVEVGQKAVDLTHGDDAAILDTAALAYFLNGNAAKALELQEKAVKATPPDQLDPSVKDRLEQYRKAVPKA